MRVLCCLFALVAACGDGDRSIPPAAEVDLEVTRDLIGFGEVPLGEVETVFLSARNNTEDEAELTVEVEGPSHFSIPSPELPVAIPANDAITLTVQYAPVEAGDFEGRLLLSTQTGSAGVRLTGQARAPLVSAEPESLSFEETVGPGVLGGSAPITIRNSGDGDLVVRLITVASGQPVFELAEAFEAFTLSSNTARDVRVAYAIPLDTPADLAGELHIESNDLENPSLVVPLSAVVAPSGTTTVDHTGDTFHPTDSADSGDTGETGDTGPLDTGHTGETGHTGDTGA